MPDYVETSLHVYCSDNKLMKQIQKLVFNKDEHGQLRFNMEKLLPINDEFMTKFGYQELGHHIRKVLWGVKHDGDEIQQKFSKNKFHIEYQTPWIVNYGWFQVFCEVVRELYEDLHAHPKPELIIFFAYGIFDTIDYKGFAYYEPPQGKINFFKEIPEHKRDWLNKYFSKRTIDIYDNLW